MKIVFYKASGGRSVITEFINDLSTKDKAKIYALFLSIENHGLDAIQVQFRQIEKKLWEIKARGEDGSYRFFYVNISRDTMVIFHAYKKQSQKAPIRELETAKRRMKEVLT